MFFLLQHITAQEALPEDRRRAKADASGFSCKDKNVKV
jgi:hypothetical protein